MAASQAFEHQLNIVAGYFGRGMLMKVLKPASGSVANALAGRAGYIDNNGQWVAGFPPSKKGPALLVFRGVNQPDVYNDGSRAGGGYWWVGGNQGYITCIPTTGGFEVQTTEYDTSKTYTNGNALNATTAGLITNAVTAPYTNGVLGFACPFLQYPENAYPSAPTALGPVGTNANQVNVLNFYTCFLPAT